MNLFIVLLAAALSIVRPVLSGNEFNYGNNPDSASNDTRTFVNNSTFPSANNTTCPSHYKHSDGKLTVNGKFVFSESKHDKIQQLTEVPHDYVQLKVNDLPLSMQDIVLVNGLFHNKLTSVILERVVINDSTGYFDFSKCNELKKLHIVQSTVLDQLQNSLKSVPSKLDDVNFTRNKVNGKVIELLKEHELSELDLTACKLFLFPIELMKGLKKLNLSGNPIGTVFGNMVEKYNGEFAITVLNLSSAGLSCFNVEYLLNNARKFPKISVLNIASNIIPLDSLKDIQSGFPSLKSLQLTYDEYYHKTSEVLQILNEKNSSITFPTRSSAQSVKIHLENKDNLKSAIDCISQLNIIANPCIQHWYKSGVTYFPLFDTGETFFGTVMEISFNLCFFSNEDIEKLSKFTFPKLDKVSFNFSSEKELPVLQSLMNNSNITDLQLSIANHVDGTKLASALQITHLKILTFTADGNLFNITFDEFFTKFFDKIRSEEQKYALKSLHIKVDIGDCINALLGALPFFPELESLEVASKNLNEFSTDQTFPNLERLLIGLSSKEYKDQVSSKFIALFPNLSQLELNPPSNSQVLREIVENCKNLREVSLKTYFTSESDDALLSLSKLPMIVSIDIVENLDKKGNFIWDDSIKDKFNYLISFGYTINHDAIKKLKDELKKRNVTRFYPKVGFRITSAVFQ